MNPATHDYLAMYQTTQAYLKLSTAYSAYLGGIRWSSEDDAIDYPDGTCFVYCVPIAEFLEGFNSGGRVIPFGCVLHWVDLLQNHRKHLDPTVRRLRTLFQESGTPWRNAGALAALVSDVVPEPAVPPRLDHVCRRLRDQAFPIRWFVARFHESVGGTAEAPAIAPEQFERLVLDRLATHSDDVLRSWLRDGRGPLASAGERLMREQPPPRTLTGILAALLLRPRLAGAETYVTRLVGALTLPPRRLTPQELPVGGYADMTTHGAVEHILPSQYALDELEFLRRFAERELLYFRREEPPAQNRQEMIVLIDQGVRTWGDVRLVLAAAALALGKQAARREQPFRLAGTSNAGRVLDPLEADDDALGELMEASDVSFHPGGALETVLQEPSEALRDVVVLTHPRNLREADVLAAARRAGPRDRLFALALDDQGAAAVSEIRHGAAVTLRQFRIDFAPAPAPTAPADEALATLPAWTGDVEPVPFPFRFGTTGRITHFDFDHTGRWLLTVSGEDMLHLWGLGTNEREVLPRPVSEDGQVLRGYHRVIGVTGGFVLVSAEPSRVVAIYYDVIRRRCIRCTRTPGSSVLHARYLPEHHMLRLLIGGAQDRSLFNPLYLSLAVPEVLTRWQVDALPDLQQAFQAADLAMPLYRESIDSGASDPELCLSPGASAQREYAVDVERGAITVRHAGQAQTFIPLDDGKPLLRRSQVSAAHAAGDVLALLARLSDGSLRLLLFTISSGATLCERRYDPRLDEERRFVLSPDGRWLAREWGARVIIEKIDSPGVQTTTRIEGYNSEGQLLVGERCFVIGFGQKHWHLVRWSERTVEFHYECKQQGAFQNAAIQAAMREPLLVARAASAAAPPTYDRERFVAVAYQGALFFDRYGQIAVFDRAGMLVCMFMAFRDRHAAWLPDGSRCGSAALGLGPETPGAREKLARALSCLRLAPADAGGSAAP
jgi:hypothetical protein